MTSSKSTVKNGKKYCLFFIKYQFKVFFFQHVSCTYSLSVFFFFFLAYLIYLSIVLFNYYCKSFLYFIPGRGNALIIGGRLEVEYNRVN